MTDRLEETWLARERVIQAARERLQAAWETGCAEGQIMPLLVEVRETIAALKTPPISEGR